MSETNIFTFDEVLSPKECDALITWTESVGYAAAPVTTDAGPQMMSGVRNNARVMIDDPARAGDLWARVEGLLPSSFDGGELTGANPRLRFYRYDPGERFKLHADGYYRKNERERSVLTFMVYLNEGFEGGETRFVHRAITPRRGMALLFKHRLLHEGVEVTAGRKYVLRTDVMARFDSDA